MILNILYIKQWSNLNLYLISWTSLINRKEEYLSSRKINGNIIKKPICLLFSCFRSLGINCSYWVFPDDFIFPLFDLGYFDQKKILRKPYAPLPILVPTLFRYSRNTLVSFEGQPVQRHEPLSVAQELEGAEIPAGLQQTHFFLDARMEAEGY